MDHPMICTMCEEAPATTTYGAPVCQLCREWLVGLNGDLDAMEKADPALRKAAGEVADAARRFFDAQ